MSRGGGQKRVDQLKREGKNTKFRVSLADGFFCLWSIPPTRE
jgi:hypothetical protein